MFRPALLILLLAPLVSASCRATRSGVRYLALGDSYTCGQSVEQQDSFPFQLLRAAQSKGIDMADPQVVAETGWTTRNLIMGLNQAKLEGSRFDLVTLAIGVNNQFNGMSLVEYGRQFEMLLDSAVALAGGRPSRVIVLSIPDWGVTPYAAKSGRDLKSVAPQINAFNAKAQAICAAKKVAFVDVTGISRQAASDPSLITTDGLHPSGKQYALWVQALLPKVLTALGR